MCDNFFSVKDSLLFKSGKPRSIKMCVMDFASHGGITLSLIGRSMIQRVCLFDVYLFVPFHSMTLNLSPLLQKRVSY